MECLIQLMRWCKALLGGTVVSALRSAQPGRRNPTIALYSSSTIRGLTGSHRQLYSAGFAASPLGEPESPCGGIGRRARLKIEFRKECWFDSGQGHHRKLKALNSQDKILKKSHQIGKWDTISFTF